MQRAGPLVAAVLLVPGVTSTRILHSGHQKPQHGLYMEDVEACAEKMSQYFTAEHPTNKDTVKRRLVDGCNEREEVDLRPTVCPHMDRMITDSQRVLCAAGERWSLPLASAEDSLWKVTPVKLMTPAYVCERTEAHMTELQGVAKMPRVGSGMIHFSGTKKTCESTVEAALDGAPTIISSNVPNFWYALCMNQ
ncbi:unnamed protein product, partial [Prorocentrum cordatum]